MALTDQRISVRFPHAHLIERGVDTTLYAPMYLDGALVAPTADPVITIYDENGDAVVSAATGTTDGNVSEYTLAAATSTSLDLAEGWRAEWTLTHAGGTVRASNVAHLVRRLIHPVISDVDLFEEVKALDPGGTAPITAYSNFQTFLDGAWRKLQRWLIRKGQRPWLVLEPSGLAEPHLYATLELVFADLVVQSNNPDYAATARDYRERYRGALADLSLIYDRDEDGDVDFDEDGRPLRHGQPTIWLTGRD